MERPLPKRLQAAAKKYDDRFAEGWTEQDDFNGVGTWSHWLYLRRGWCNAVLDGPGLHIIHEPYVRDVLKQLKGAQPCDCAQCRGEGA